MAAGACGNRGAGAATADAAAVQDAVDAGDVAVVAVDAGAGDAGGDGDSSIPDTPDTPDAEVMDAAPDTAPDVAILDVPDVAPDAPTTDLETAADSSDVAQGDTAPLDTALPDTAPPDTTPEDAGPCSWPDPYLSPLILCTTAADCPVQTGMKAVCTWGPLGSCYYLPQVCGPAAAATTTCDDFADGTVDSCNDGLCSHTCLPPAMCDLSSNPEAQACIDQNPCTWDVCTVPLSLPGSDCVTCNHIPIKGCCFQDSDCPPASPCWTATCKKLSPGDTAGQCTATNVCCQ